MRPLCQASLDVTLLFTSENPQAWEACVRICHRCPVLAECRERTLQQEANGLPVHGVAGGLTPFQRPHAVRPKPFLYAAPPTRSSAPCGTYAAARAHQRADEPLDHACRDALTSYWRKQRRRLQIGAAS